MKNRLACLLALICLAFPLTAPAMRIGALPAADSLALYVAADEGLFRKHGLDVDIVPFQSAIELGAAVRAKAVDGYFGDIINMVLLHESGVPQSIVATTSYVSPSMPDARFFGIAVSPGSARKTVDDLRGARVAIGRATIVDFMLDRMLEKEGRDSAFVEHLDIKQIPVRLQMLMAGQVDAAVLPEPLLSLAEARGAAVVLDDRKLSMPLAVVAFHREQAVPERVAPFQAALAEAMGKINADPESYRQVMAAKKLLPAGATSYRMVRFDPARTPYGLPAPDDMRDVLDWMHARNLLRPGAKDGADTGIVYAAPAARPATNPGGRP